MTMSFKDALKKAKGGKSPFPIDGVMGDGAEPAEGEEEKPEKKKGGFKAAAKNAKKKKSKK